ncbi:MAG: hypothetical protein GC159_07640 [Phycisphaera sp.]|nr:hypothetical protein [Phycisphaera sp.]
MTDHNTVAAIDAGSNGIRMTVGRVNADGSLTEQENYRAAVRLGADTFGEGRFSGKTIDLAIAAFDRFAYLLREHEVDHVRAVATSATRDAENGDELVQRVKAETGIDIEVIDGISEAQIIYNAVGGVRNLAGQYVLIDMGGGSVEVTVSRNGRALGCESLRLGPVRLLQELNRRGLTEADTPQLLERYRGAVGHLIRAELDEASVTCVGTGGNIERMGKLRCQLLGKGQPAKVKTKDLELLIPKLMAMPMKQRITKLGLRPDRADVIAIACHVLHMIVQEIDQKRVSIPGVGLKEGLLREVAREINPNVTAAIIAQPVVWSS